MKSPWLFSLICILLLLASFVFQPELDLIVSGWFAAGREGFPWRESWGVQALKATAFWGARALGVGFLLGFGVAALRRREVFRLSGKAWLFLLLALLIGPGLVANGIFKDHWGRARPREITQFGGQAAFSPPLLRSQACADNCSFVSGDGAFGFFLPTFAYVVAPRRSRRVFWGGMALGCVFGGARIVAGAHFLSDVLFAAFFMLLVSALLHALMFGRKPTQILWRLWFARNSQPPVGWVER